MRKNAVVSVLYSANLFILYYFYENSNFSPYIENIILGDCYRDHKMYENDLRRYSLEFLR